MITNSRTNIINEKKIEYKKKSRINIKIKSLFAEYFNSNLKEVACTIAIISIGILISIFLVNNSNNLQKNEIIDYINNFFQVIKNGKNINHKAVFLYQLRTNAIYTVLLWFAGLTIIGVPIAYTILCFKGFSLGYTISSIIAAIGKGKGTIFVFSSMFFQNLIEIPALIAITISGIKIYRTVIKRKNKSNIKLEFIRHTITCLLIFNIFVIDAFFTGYISTILIEKTVKFL